MPSVSDTLQTLRTRTVTGYRQGIISFDGTEWTSTFGPKVDMGVGVIATATTGPTFSWEMNVADTAGTTIVMFHSDAGTLTCSLKRGDGSLYNKRIQRVSSTGACMWFGSPLVGETVLVSVTGTAGTLTVFTAGSVVSD